MTSDSKTAANQQNAQKSTGPITPEGKFAVSLNALKHGLRSRIVVMPGESREEYEKLCADYHAEWQPETPTETQYVMRMVINLWKQERMERLEVKFQADQWHDTAEKFR